MSGFEVVGVVLGVLPLVISAIENYERITEPVHTYRKYSKVLKTFTTELNVQRDIFQNECIWILSRFVDGHELEDMLKDPSHHLRDVIRGDRNLDRTVSTTIGASYRQVLGILQLLKETLDEIYEETKDFSEGLSKPSRTEEEPVDLRAWRRHINRKLKLSFGKPSLNEKISELRHRNQAFLAISQQIVRFNAYTWSPTQTQWDIQSADKNLEKIKRLRTASETLYRRLERLRSCKNHPEHSANLRLSLETSESYVHTSSKMSFDMALTYWDVEQSNAKSQDLILLAIESMAEETSTTKPTTKREVRFFESQPSKDIAPPQIPVRNLENMNIAKNTVEKEVRFKDSQLSKDSTASQFLGRDPPDHVKPHRRSIFRKALRVLKGDGEDTQQTPIKSKAFIDVEKAPQIRLPARTQTVHQAQAPLVDLGSVPNLCLRILELAKQESMDRNVCMGYLAGQGADRYIVYGRQAATSASSTTISLSRVISNHRRLQSLPKQDKWRLAGALSLAVLLYHSTPWLQTTLKSDDILFFNFSDAEQSISLKAPHLHSSQRSTGKGSEGLPSSTNTWTKNEILYRLGVMLLEIEFEDTLESLIERLKLPGLPGMAVPLIDNLTLLKRRAGEQLGTLYGRIVRMCLDCDFGLGLEEYTLDDPRVQRIFYSQIVRQFQERMPEYSKIWADS